MSEQSWTFEIRRAELGEPIRVLLEQASPEAPATPRPPALVGGPGDMVVQVGPARASVRVERTEAETERRAREAERRAREQERRAAEQERRREERQERREPN